jgi:hypothetical protein
MADSTAILKMLVAFLIENPFARRAPCPMGAAMEICLPAGAECSKQRFS